MSTATTKASGHPDKYRLPTNVKPVHYDVVIKTDLENLEFGGLVKIQLDIKEETSTVTFNSNGLDLTKAVIYSHALQIEQEQTGHSLDKDQQRVTCEFEKPLPAGSKADLKIYYTGKLTGSMTGYYKSGYEVEGKQKFYALTQFEASLSTPTSARDAFPCWDEPLLKATFGITMISRANTVNLSNMPALSEKVLSDLGSELDGELSPIVSSLKDDASNWKVTKFDNTPPMSSYIVAWANGQFEYLEDSVKLREKTIPLRIYATADNIHQAKFALQVKKDVLPLYEQVFDVAFPLPKLDTLVASDFDAGAMENWGLITGRTSAFLLDPAKADLAAKQRVAEVQSHEVAHMWFGNITTMEWWNYLYLNEGFATLMGEVIIADKVFPEWKVDSNFIQAHLNRALALDSKLSSHPIEVECPDANHINQIFDSLSYSKAASVLRMLSNYVGEDLFLKGVSLYLKEKLYGNSVTNDLWKGISTSTGKDIVGLMTNWIEKIGFPVLTVTETANGIKVRQDRFLETGIAEDKENTTVWNVPLSILSVGKDGKPTVDRTALLTEREQTFELDTSKPFKLNAGTTGVYRVLYTPEHLSKLAQEAAKPEGQGILALNDRVGLVHDTMALSKAGLAKLSSALTLIEGLKGEAEYLVWSGIAEAFSSLVSVWWEYPELVEKLNAFRRELFVPLVEKLGYENSEQDHPDTISLRSIAVGQAAAAKDPKVIQELQSRFAHFVKTGDDSSIPADIQKTIYTIAVRHGGQEEYDAIVRIHDKPRTPTSRIAAMLAMGATEVPELQQRTFKFIAEKSRDQDVMYYFRGLESNFKTRRALAQYFKDEYEALYKRFEGNFTLKYLVEMSVGSLSTEKDYEEVQAFFKDKDNSKYSMSLAQSLDNIRARSAYIARSTDDMAAWFQSRPKL